MIGITRIMSPVQVDGMTQFIDIDEKTAEKIKRNETGISKLAKVVGNKAITFYMDKNLKVRGTEIAELVGIDTSVPGSFAAFCTSIENKIKEQKCEGIASPILRTVCKKDEYKNCDRLKKNQLVSLICKK